MNNFIDQEYIKSAISGAVVTDQVLDLILAKAKATTALTVEEVAILLNVSKPSQIKKMESVAGYLKDVLYGNRVVIFAPLYISDHCTNNCQYCGYRRDNEFDRYKLTDAQIVNEVKALEKLGHKRLALEVGEDNLNAPLDYILDSIDKIYAAGDIRRINVNIAPLDVEGFKRLKEKEIGTYILFQETYNKEAYESCHPESLKGDYFRQLFAHHKAQEAGIDDVGGGVLFGISDYKEEILSLFIHNAELEEKCGVGWHTVSVPRIQKAEGVDVEQFKHLVSDDEFAKIVTVLRLCIPFAGIIISTRETIAMRERVLKLGTSQISAGSIPDVGGYEKAADEVHTSQFELSDERSPLEIIEWLLELGYIPSYCTACYRMGRTGHHFMEIVRAGDIHRVCTPNAILTLAEYIECYGRDKTKELGYKLIEEKMGLITDDEIKEKVLLAIEAIKNGERDIFV